MAFHDLDFVYDMDSFDFYDIMIDSIRVKQNLAVSKLSLRHTLLSCQAGTAVESRREDPHPFHRQRGANLAIVARLCVCSYVPSREKGRAMKIGRYD